MVLYLTDLEGRWDKLVDALEGCALAVLDGDRLVLHPDVCLVYGGDTVDRGSASLRLVRCLVDAAARYGDRVVLLAGNRDINKLRLPRELGASPREGAPGPLPERLKWILARTMGAGNAFAHRAEEIGGDDDAVVRSFLDEVGDGGSLRAYLERAQLAYRWRDVLFVHGAVTDASFGQVPLAEPVDGVDRWILALNRFYAAQMASYVANPTGFEHDALIAYQAPTPGTRANPTSVVYGRPVDALGNPELPSVALRARLRADGIARVVVGHTPSGDTPSFLYDDGFTLILADNSYSPLERGSRVELYADHTRLVGTALLDAPTRVDVRLELDIPPPLGTWQEGWLIKGRLDDAWLGFRFEPGFQARQQRRD